MLQITIPESERYDEINNLFIKTESTTLRLEHSLVSLSKWESKWNKPFLSKDPLTYEQTIDYIRCMTISQGVDPMVYYNINNDLIKQVKDYIDAPMTATWFSDNGHGRNREIITAEIIYYWMIALNIPFECQKWHLNRLMTLIQVCNIKNTPPKKMSKSEIMSKNRALNEARKKAYNTSG